MPLNELPGLHKRPRVAHRPTLIVMDSLKHEPATDEIFDLLPLMYIVCRRRSKLSPERDGLAATMGTGPLGPFTIIGTLEAPAAPEARVWVQV